MAHHVTASLHSLISPDRYRELGVKTHSRGFAVEACYSPHSRNTCRECHGKGKLLVSVGRVDSESWKDRFELPLVANTLLSKGKHCKDVRGMLANWCCIT